MSDQDFTPERLLDFLREAPKQGLLNPAVARSRANAIDALFTVLTPAERADIRRIDVDRLPGRLHKVQGSTIRPEVLELYRIRVGEALVDYLAWLGNPGDFATISGNALRRDLRCFVSPPDNAEEARALEDIALAVSERRKDYLTVPLRDGVTVYISNLPFDLSAAEAGRIARVVMALAATDGAGADDAHQ
ncbi:MAG: hypothetical protein MEQ07_08560 [Aquimonas sp.]|nr:hypothetical protein [Aquimonas sp.]